MNKPIVPDLIYRTTFFKLYNMPAPWAVAIGVPDQRTENPHNKHLRAQLYHRPRVESYLLAHRSAYEHALHLRAARFTDLQGVQFQITHTRLAKITITQQAAIPPSLPDLYAQMRHTYFFNYAEELPAAWQPTPYEVAAYCRLHFTDYVFQLNQFHDQVGSGFAFLNLRHQADALVAQLLTTIV